MKYVAPAMVVLVFGAACCVRAQDVVTLLSPGSFQPPIVQLIPNSESTTGHKIKAAFRAGGAIKQMVVRGDVFDVIIPQPPYTEALASGNIVAVSATPLASVALGAAVRKGAPKPDLSTPEAVKRTLLDAKSISYPEEAGATVARQLHAVVEKLGIAAQLESKMKPASNGPAALALVAKGEAEIGVTFLSGMNQPGVELAGAFPSELAPPVEFVGFAGAHAKDPAAAKAVLDYLSSPEATAVYKTHGMQAGR
jgi:molybdate transport system substrate-binding protein